MHWSFCCLTLTWRRPLVGVDRKGLAQGQDGANNPNRTCLERLLKAIGNFFERAILSEPDSGRALGGGLK